MTGYRLYVLNSEGRIARSPIILECEHDEAAISAAQSHHDAAGMELWQASRLVARWNRDGRIPG